MSTTTPMSWEDYQQLPEDLRFEYIDGQLVVNPGPIRRHQLAVHRLASLLEAAAADPVCVVAQWAWKPGDDEFAPDVLVTGPTDEQLRFTGMPLLVIEVLSSNRSHDLVTKSNKYARAGLPRYWVVDPDAQTVTAFVLRGGIYEEVATVGGTDLAELDFGAGTVRIRPAELFD